MIGVVLLGDGKYQHTLTYANVECNLGCILPYTIESAIGDCSSTSEVREAKTYSCLLGM